MKTEKFAQYGLYLFLLGIGIIIGIAIRHYNNIPISDTINIIDVAALVTTIFLAVYIPEVLDRKLRIRRDKKKLISSRIDELQYLYGRINRIVQQSRSRQLHETGSLLDICGSRLATIIMLIDHAGMKPMLGREIQETAMLCKTYRDLFAPGGATEGEKEAVRSFLDEEERLYSAIDRATSLIIFMLSDA